jgi:CRP-like cAMP-binding protein
MTRLPAPVDARQNRLLALLPDVDLERVQRNLQPVFLIAGQALYEPGCILDCAYFPATAIVSLEYVMADGKSAEVAIVGNEGIVGIALFMGGESRPNRAVVQASGWAYRLRRHHLHEEFARGGALQHVLLLYTQALLTLTAQTVICNRHHTVDQQLCRWLLLSLDRSPSSVVTTTHEHIAHMLGVRRESVTEAAGNLQRLGLVRNSRGQVTVIDRAGLESRSCECYRVVRREYDRLLPVATLSEKPGC